MADSHSKLTLHTGTRYKQLDSLRGVAAITVCIRHFVDIFTSHSNFLYKIVSASPIGALYNGPAAVVFFFVLSGFVLSLPFMNSERPLKLTEFYTKRVFRIYPAYIATLLLALLLKYFLFADPQVHVFSNYIEDFWHWKMTPDIAKEIGKSFLLCGPDFNCDLLDAVVWSLAVEMRVSLVLPFFIVVASKSNIVFDICFLFVMIFPALHHNWPIYMTVFYLGIMLAKYKGKLIGLIDKIPMWGVLLLGVIGLVLYNNNNFYYYRDLSFFELFGRDVIMAIGSCIIIILAISKQGVARFFEKKLFLFLGEMSYSFYLVHLPFLIVFCSIFHKADVISYCWILLSTFASSILVSFLFYNYIEMPFQKFGKTLIKKYRSLRSFNISFS